MQVFKFFSQFQTYSKNIRLILIWNMVFCFGLGIHLILYNLYLQEIVQNEVIVGKILGLNFLAQAIIYIPAGLFSDQVGSKKGVLAGISLFIAALLGNLFASTSNELLFWGFLVGLGHAASIVTFVPLLTEYSTPLEKKDLFTFAFSTGTFSTFLGTLVSGILSDTIHNVFQISTISSMRITFSLTTLLLLLCTVPLLFVKEKEPHIKSGNKIGSPFSLLRREPKKFIPILKFSFSKALAGVSLGIIAPFMNLFFLQKFDLTPSKISLVLAGGTLFTVFFMTYNSKVTKRISEVKTVSLYHLLSIPAILLLGMTQHIWVAAFAYFIYRSAKFGLNPIESKIIMEKVDPKVRGLANSFGFMTNSLMISMLGPLAMYVVQVAGTNKGYFILCVISAVGSLVAAIYFQLAFEGKRKPALKEIKHATSN